MFPWVNYRWYSPTQVTNSGTFSIIYGCSNSSNATLAMDARHTYAPLVLVFVGRGSAFEEEMDSLLVDDPVGHEKSYVDFLCDVHQAVCQKSSDD